MINASVITSAITKRLNDGLSDDFTIERNEYLNNLYDKLPWIGIYRGDIDYDPHTLGKNAPSGWRADVTVKIIVQSSNLNDSGEKAEDDQEGYIKEVLDLVMADKTFGGAVAIVKAINVRYTYSEADSEDVYFQNAELSILMEVRTS